MIHTEQKNNNLTALRWFAALMVLYSHAFVFLGQKHPHFLGMVPVGPLGVWIFFSISGYLIMQSWTHDPHLLRFLAKRALRIFPALVVCIVLSMFVLGPVLTTLDLSTYLRHPMTWDYLDNIFLYITYQLPGVFAANTHPNAVNGSIWSLPVEFFMYLVIAIVGVLKAPRWVWLILGVIVVLLAQIWAIPPGKTFIIYRTDVRQVLFCGSFFMVGAAFYLCRFERFFNLSTVGALTLLWLCLSAVPDLFLLSGWLILPFITLGFGLSQGLWLSRLSRHDYSYGIYIYAFPVQQSLVHFYPQQTIAEHLVSATLITVGLAALSWHLVEKRALKFKPYSRAPKLPLTSVTADQTH
jgi:peptidoglycan/LPS O-acetylase OafA/YrhL